MKIQAVNIVFSLFFFTLSFCMNAQPERPVPYPVFPPPAFEQAVQNGTRTHTGRAGDAYWTNYATYELEAVVSPDTRTLQGEAGIVYRNQSPDTLQELVFHLYQNLNAPGAPRTFAVNVTEGMIFSEVEMDDQPLIERNRRGIPGYYVDHTLMYVRPAAPLLPGAEVELEISWQLAIPPAPNPRMGQDGEVFFLAYWYPQLAVYDDLRGWDEDPYLGSGEFYMGYADYDVRITVPEGYLVGATGELQNGEVILTTTARQRLEQAATSRETVAVVTSTDLREGRATLPSESGVHTWHFTAEKVRDFAFGTSDRYLWDATFSQVTGQEEPVMIHALYRPERQYWKEAALYGQFSIEYLSELLWPYPWPQMTIMEGLIGGGMEYPMITLIGSDRDKLSTMSVIIHEIGHMWFPMIVGTDEKAYTWLDEGLTRYNQNEGMNEFFDDYDPWHPVSGRPGGYFRIAGTGNEVASMRHGDRYPPRGSARGIASYDKPAMGLRALEGIFGREKFLAAYREYGRRWAYRHPSPYDFFNTFEEVLGEDLDWFWSSFLSETWTLDQAVAGVKADQNAVTVTIDDRGLLPMPAPVRVTYADGRTAEKTVPVSEWLAGRRTATLRFPGGKVTAVEIDPEAYLPDTDRQNNRWEKGPE